MTIRSGVSAALAGCLGAMLAAQGTSPFSDFRNERAGVVHKITLADLPAPFATPAVQNPSTLIPRPQGEMPQTLPGYSVRMYADGLQNPRLIRTAPNGDVNDDGSNSIWRVSYGGRR
jgi:glucose/arabinose dehydrogenase